jgi:hypothetical protein
LYALCSRVKVRLELGVAAGIGEVKFTPRVKRCIQLEGLCVRVITEGLENGLPRGISIGMGRGG